MSRLILICLAAIVVLWLPLQSFSQNGNTAVPDKLKIHQETPGDQYMPNAFKNLKTSPGRHYKSAGTFTSQVNVDANGNNILGDAANEPSIAVNPLDPKQMVIGWRQFETVISNFRQAGIGYTTDEGQTWTFPGPIDPMTFRSDPVLDADSSGTIYYNSLTSNAGLYTCRVFRSNTGGASWDAGVEAQGGDKQWMAIDRSGGVGSGNIYSFWTANYSSCMPGFFTRSTDAGNSYENCVVVDGNPFWGTLTVGNQGELYIAGAGSGDGIMVTRSSNAKIPGASVTWDFTSQAYMDGYITSAPEVNPVGLLGQAYIDVDRSDGPGRGNIYVLASMVRLSNGDPGDVMFAKSMDGGYTWSEPLRINNDPTDFHHQWFGTMSVAPNGRIDVVWLDTRNDPDLNIMSALYYCYSTDQGETWSINKQLSDIFDPHAGWPQQSKMGDYFDMESDNAGAHLAWANTLNGEQDVYYTRILPSIVAVPEKTGTRESLILENMPNPFRDKTRIKYTVPADGHVNLSVFNLYGQKVCTLVDEQKSAGMFTLEFDASDLPSGWFTGKLTIGNQSVNSRMLKVR
jgi:hypothetical protein